jgi:alpha-1,3-mannosyltransferase
VVCIVWALQEWAWNVFPSTPVSSGVVVFALAFTDRTTWMWGNRAEAATTAATAQKPKSFK